MEILQTIAMLCATVVSTGNVYHGMDNSQAVLACQKYYIKCLDLDNTTTVYQTILLSKCVLKRDIK